MKKVMVLNCGSSSVKYKLFDHELNPLAWGIVERIGIPDSLFKFENMEGKQEIKQDFPTHISGMEFLLEQLVQLGAVSSLDEIGLVGHRVVHGGEKYHQAVIVDQQVLNDIYDLVSLSPLHNQANGDGIKIMMDLLPQATNVAVFDTAYHQTMSEVEYIYPLNYDYYKDYQVRRYGMHGTSHKYCMQEVSKILGTDEFKMINCHLGAGGSLCAIDNQKSIATTMGLTPLAGIMMATRCGDIDPSIIQYLCHVLDEDVDSVTQRLNKESGLLGVSQVSSDIRDVVKGWQDGDKNCQLALELYVNRIVDYISSYINKLGGVDVICFTAGIGENCFEVREWIVEKLKYFGLEMDLSKNIRLDKAYDILSTPNSSAKIIMLAVDEELAIAKESKELV